MNVIKQYGLERSGTNYIKALIEINCNNTFICASMFGAKHHKYKPVLPGYNPMSDPRIRHELTPHLSKVLMEKFSIGDVCYIVSIKNPYSWIVSYRDFVKRHKLDHNIEADYLVDKWNEYNTNWISSLSDKKLYVSEYEKLILDMRGELKKVVDFFGLTLNGEIQDIRYSMGEGVDVHGSKNITTKTFDKREYYRTQEYKLYLSIDENEYIKRNADFSLLS